MPSGNLEIGVVVECFDLGESSCARREDLRSSSSVAGSTAPSRCRCSSALGSWRIKALGELHGRRGHRIDCRFLGKDLRGAGDAGDAKFFRYNRLFLLIKRRRSHEGEVPYCGSLLASGMLAMPSVLFSSHRRLSQVKTDLGRWSKGKKMGTVRAFLGIPLCRAAGRRFALESRPHPRRNGTGSQGYGIWFTLHAGKVYGDMVFRDSGGERRLSVAECVGRRRMRRREAAGDGLDLWRRLRRGWHLGRRGRMARNSRSRA